MTTILILKARRVGQTERVDANGGGGWLIRYAFEIGGDDDLDRGYVT